MYNKSPRNSIVSPYGNGRIENPYTKNKHKAASSITSLPRLFILLLFLSVGAIWYKISQASVDLVIDDTKGVAASSKKNLKTLEEPEEESIPLETEFVPETEQDQILSFDTEKVSEESEVVEETPEDLDTSENTDLELNSVPDGINAEPESDLNLDGEQDLSSGKDIEDTSEESVPDGGINAEPKTTESEEDNLLFSADLGDSNTVPEKESFKNDTNSEEDLEDTPKVYKTEIDPGLSNLVKEETAPATIEENESIQQLDTEESEVDNSVTVPEEEDVQTPRNVVPASPLITEASSAQSTPLLYKTGLVTWLKADNGVIVDDSCTAQDCPVIEWADASGNDNHFKASSENTNAPILTTSTTQNHPVIEFTSHCPLVNPHMHLHDGMTLFFVFFRENNVALSGNFFGTEPYGQFTITEEPSSLAAFVSVGGKMSNTENSLSDYSSSPAAIVTYRLNSNVEIKVGNNPFVIPTNARSPRFSDAPKVSLGSSTSSNTCKSGLNGAIAEVLIYGKVLTNAQVELVQQYLDEKYQRSSTSTTKETPDTSTSTAKKTPETSTSNTKKIPETTSTSSDKTPETTSTTKKTPETSTETQENTSTSSDKIPETSTTKKTPETSTTKKPETTSNHKIPETANANNPDTTNQEEEASPLMFNPDDVFTWKAPEGDDNTKLWNNEVATRLGEIQRFQYGGDVLKAFIRGKKDELNSIRLSMFRYVLHNK